MSQRFSSNAHRVAGTAAAALGVLAFAPMGVAHASTPPGNSPFTGTPSLVTITNGSTAAPWNSSQGDPAIGTSASVLPSYTPPAAGAAPNLAVYPGATSGTAGNSPYPSGIVGTPGPLDAYCGSGNYTTEAAGTPARQPAGTTLPLAPAYFPHIVKNTNGSLTGYFDYRPKDADEAIVTATSTDTGKSWTYQGEALEQNNGYCSVGDVNDDGEGHPQILTIGGVTRLYTLQRAAGDAQGVGMTVHTLSTPTALNPLAGVPTTEKVGIDPDAFATSAVAVSSTPVTIPVTSTGTVGSPELLLAGEFVDLTHSPVPTAASVITCTGVTAETLTGCTNPAGFTISSSDLIEQVIATVTAAATVPAGPEKTDGTGGLKSLALAFANPQTGTLFNADAPNRAYVNGVAIYCVQANANPVTTAAQDCVTQTGTAAVNAAVGDPFTSDPIIPATAAMTSGLVAPDGIVDTLPHFPGVPGGATGVLYTQKYANYFIAGKSTNAADVSFGSTPFTLTFAPSPYVGQDLPATVSATSPVTISIGDDNTLAGSTSKSTIIPATCTGLTPGGTYQLTGCTVPSAFSGESYPAYAMIGAPGAATADPAVLAQTGQGAGAVPSAKNIAKLDKNNEDLALLRVAYTTDGLTFSTAGLANGGVISGTSNGAANYTDLSNPTTNASPANLNDGSALTDTEMRFIGSAGTVVTNPDGSLGLFLSGAWAADGDSDSYNRIFYATSKDGGATWSVPTTVVNTDYTFSDSVAQSKDETSPLGIGAYYEGRAYGPNVISNGDGTLTMLFAGYRLPKTVAGVGTSLGSNSSALYTVGAQDPALYRNILVETLTPAAATPPTSLPEAPVALLIPIVGLGAFGAVTLRRRRRVRGAGGQR